MMVMMMMMATTTTATRRCAGSCVCMDQRLVCRRTLPGRMLAPSRVRNLDLRGLPPSLLSGWRGVAARFPNLESVDVRGSGLCLTPEPGLTLLSDCSTTTQGKTRDCIYIFLTISLDCPELSLSDVNTCMLRVTLTLSSRSTDKSKDYSFLFLASDIWTASTRRPLPRHKSLRPSKFRYSL